MSTQHTYQRCALRSRGSATLFAMTMLAVMGTLAVVLWAGAAASRQMAREDRNATRAMAAAESGVNYMHHMISRIRMKQQDAYGQEVIRQWHTKLAQRHNAAKGNNDTTLTFTDIVPHAGSGQSFTAVLTVAGELDRKGPPMNLRVTGTDLSSGTRRRISVNLNPLDTTDRIFRYGVASRGRIDLAKGKSNLFGSPADAGSILSTYPDSWAIWLAGGTITGDVAVVGDPSVSFVNEGGTVGGKVSQIDAPDFPEFLPNQYNLPGLRQLPDPSGNNAGPFQNVRITSNFTFNGNDVIQGLIYVKPGVTIDFQGNPIVQGVIVVEDPGTGATSTSTLRFQGVPTFDTPVWPNDGRIPPDVRQDLKGYSVLGPTSYIYISGSGGGSSAKSGFAGTVVCGTFAEHGSGMVKVRDGAVISMAQTASVGLQGVSCWLEGDGINVLRTPAYTVPQGAYMRQLSWVIDNSSYSELLEDQ